MGKKLPTRPELDRGYELQHFRATQMLSDHGWITTIRSGINDVAQAHSGEGNREQYLLGCAKVQVTLDWVEHRLRRVENLLTQMRKRPEPDDNKKT